MKVKYTSTNLPFVHPFTISKGTKTHQPALLVQLEHLGIRGVGEAPAIAYYNIPVEKMIADLTAKKMFVEKFAFTEPGRYWHYLHHLLPNNGFLVCALDIAAWDMYGKMKRQPLHKFWSKGDEKMPVTDFTIGIDTIEKMLAKMDEKPWPIYKIKLGTSEDIAIMEALRKHTDALFRIDANAA
jgi:L-alanine-DL-glutamate epimerase-like enolase superfamily enzyme